MKKSRNYEVGLETKESGIECHKSRFRIGIRNRKSQEIPLTTLLTVCSLLLVLPTISGSPEPDFAGHVHSPSTKKTTHNPGNNLTYQLSSPAPEVASQSFVPSASVDDPIFASRTHNIHPSPHHHPQHQHDHDPPHLHLHPHDPPHHLQVEHPPGLLEKKLPKGRLDGAGRGIASIDKSPPELQFGLSFTVPFMSLSTDRLLSSLTGKSFSDPYTSDVASLLKLNVGGLILATVVGLAALVFIPSLLPGKLPGLFSNGFPHGLMPGFLDQLMPGLGLNKPFGYGQYDHQYDPYSSDYANYKNEDGYEGRGRSIKSRGAGNSTVYTELFSTVQKAVHNYWGDVEGCASHAMCLRGKRMIEERSKKAQELKQQRRSSASKTTDGSANNNKGRHSRRPEEPEDDLTALSSFEHVLEAIQGMKGITQNMPIFHQLHKAYKAGQNGVDCVAEYKKCPVTADGISNVLNNMGNYIFNS